MLRPLAHPSCIAASRHGQGAHLARHQPAAACPTDRVAVNRSLGVELRSGKWIMPSCRCTNDAMAADAPLAIGRSPRIRIPRNVGAKRGGERAKSARAERESAPTLIQFSSCLRAATLCGAAFNKAICIKNLL